MSKLNLFSTLSKYSRAENERARDENYLTEALCFVFHFLHEKEPNKCLELLDKICTNNSKHTLRADSNVEIRTQVSIKSYGQPDIIVRSTNKLILIEVKYECDINEDQLRDYMQYIEQESLVKNLTYAKVVVLTSLRIKNQDRIPYGVKHVRWFEIHDWLKDMITDSKDPTSKYVLEQFSKYLEVKQLAIVKIVPEYARGFTAYIGLLDMIAIAIQDTHIVHFTGPHTSWSWGFTGYYIPDSTGYFCGITHDEPTTVVFDTEHGNEGKFNTKEIEKCAYFEQIENDLIYFGLNLEMKNFYSISKEQQLTEIKTFVKTVYNELEGRRKVK